MSVTEHADTEDINDTNQVTLCKEVFDDTSEPTDLGKNITMQVYYGHTSMSHM